MAERGRTLTFGRGSGLTEVQYYLDNNPRRLYDWDQLLAELRDRHLRRT